jgi:predicted nucleic acid-binding protein
MTERVFLDSNIVIDFLADRVPHSDAATKLFSLAERGEIEIFICAGSYDNLYYILQDYSLGHEAILSSFRRMNRVIRAVPVDLEVVKKAIDSGFPDFEDALQYFSAKKINGVKSIISRDKKGFRKAAMTILSAEEYLKSLN